MSSALTQSKCFAQLEPSYIPSLKGSLHDFWKKSTIQKNYEIRVKYRPTLISNIQFKIIFPNTTTQLKSFAL